MTSTYKSNMKNEPSLTQGKLGVDLSHVTRGHGTGGHGNTSAFRLTNRLHHYYIFIYKDLIVDINFLDKINAL
jgi:hypothetical protein